MNYNIFCHYPESCQKDADKFLKIYSQFNFKNKYFLDIGSSIGLASFCSLDFLPSKNICFEPSKIRYNILLDNINKNNLKEQFECYNFGCSNYNFNTQMISSICGDNGGILIDDGIENRSGSEGLLEDIECIKIDDFLINTYGTDVLSKNLGFIKIDTEGHDFIILNNLKNIIQLSRPYILIEWWHNKNINDKIFEAIENINYIPLNSDSFKIENANNFHNKSSDLILIPKNN